LEKLNKFTLLLWYWGNKYPPSYVHSIIEGVRSNCTIPFETVVVTDRPELFENSILLPDFGFKHRGTLNSYCRLWGLSKGFAGIEGYVLQLDIDQRICGNIDHLLIKPKGGIGIYKSGSKSKLGYAYNPSVMLYESGRFNHIWTEFVADPEKVVARAHSAGFRGTDQELISCYCERHKRKITTWGKKDGIYSYRDDPKPYRNACIISYYGVNHMQE